MPIEFLSLPLELITLIIEYVDADTLADMNNGVCHKLLPLTTNEQLWKAHFMKDFADIPENYVNLVFQGTWRVTYRLVRASLKYTNDLEAFNEMQHRNSLPAAAYLALKPTSPLAFRSFLPAHLELLCEWIAKGSFQKRIIVLSIIEKYSTDSHGFKTFLAHVDIKSSALSIESFAKILLDTVAQKYSFVARSIAASLLQGFLIHIPLGRKIICDLEGVRIIAKLLKHPELAHSGLSLLHKFGRFNPAAPQFKPKIPRIVASLRSHDPMILAQTCELLGDLGFNETLEDDIGEAGAIELALELLKSTPGPASKVLCNLTLSKSNSKRFLNARGVEAMMEIITSGTKDEIVKSRCFGTLINILTNKVRIEIPHHLVTELLIRAESDRMKLFALLILCFNHPQDMEVQQAIEQFCTTRMASVGFMFYPQLFWFLEPAFRDPTNKIWDGIRLMALWLLAFGELGTQSTDLTWTTVKEHVEQFITDFLNHSNKRIAIVAQRAQSTLMGIK